ncbi:MAG: hypothetical protein Q8P41_09830 [Pseudomonadota bacterium]|nr:hypothetical protein [Pseudomonadota bacterium]
MASVAAQHIASEADTESPSHIVPARAWYIRTMRGLSLGCFTLLLFSRGSCCCLRIPTFGLWPDLDEAEIEAAVRAAPIVVDHVCEPEQTCAVVEDAAIEVYPLAWGPIFGEVTVLVQVDATCRESDDPTQRARPIACAGLLLASYQTAEDGGPPVFQHITEEMVFGNEPSGMTYEEWSDSVGSGGGDWD